MRNCALLSKVCSRISFNYNHVLQTATFKLNQPGVLQYSTGPEVYDLVVIGGGSGGLACAKEAAGFGKRVAVLDYVTPSPKGTTWGMGGTCVNVGCIPKKLMHEASLLGHALKDSTHYGWNTPENITHDWSKMVENVQNHVRSLNWGHRVQLKDKNVEYLNAKGSFVDENTVKAVSQNGKETLLRAKNVVLATGGRPRYLNEVPGSNELCISSDDIFSLQNPPGKTLVIGGSYVALECAGFLQGLGYPTSVMVRSICLRGFDQQMANLITDHMESMDVNFIRSSTPQRVEQHENGQRLVTWSSTDGETHRQDVFDTVLLAVGRDPKTKSLGLENTGVKLHTNGKVLAVDGEQTDVPHIYAIGDILEGGVELTPVAIKAGKILATRLFSNSREYLDYKMVATTVFSPLEYAAVGMTEDDAISKYGEENIEVYHAFYKPLQYTVSQTPADQCYMKVICCRDGDQPIIGLHILGPHAGEMMQGFSVAVQCGVTYKQLSSTVGIHPTCAEEVVKIHITKRSGDDPMVTGC
ncbi:thioredoxin reductase 2, mitochondrial-like [Antedon mediterranea]|uniref:thioredoxin reductase 2, mitochondrial-like n=1 Tax=Antedon mediterranea TaxID=105859 RepID=UPI003AF92274